MRTPREDLLLCLRHKGFEKVHKDFVFFESQTEDSINDLVTQIIKFIFGYHIVNLKFRLKRTIQMNVNCFPVKHLHKSPCSNLQSLLFEELDFYS